MYSTPIQHTDIVEEVARLTHRVAVGVAHRKAKIKRYIKLVHHDDNITIKNLYKKSLWCLRQTSVRQQSARSGPAVDILRLQRIQLPFGSLLYNEHDDDTTLQRAWRRYS